MLSLKHLTNVYRNTEVETTALRSVDREIDGPGIRRRDGTFVTEKVRMAV